MSTSRKFWLVEGPFYRYNEDVKALAVDAGLRLIDSRYANDGVDRDKDAVKDGPKLTLRPEFAPRSAEGGDDGKKASAGKSGGKASAS